MKYFLILLICSGCGANYHLKKSEQHRIKAIQKGATVKVDTVFKEIPVKVIIPSDSTEFDFGAVIDFESFRYVSDLNDSLVRQIEALKRESEPNVKALKKSNAELAKAKERLSKGFAKDSTYQFNPDSLTTIGVVMKGGIPVKVTHNIKESVVTRTIYAPVAIKNDVKPKNRYFETLVGGILIGWIIIFAVWLIVKRRSET